MRLAIVVATHIERRSFDLVFTDTGLRVPEVQCLSDMVSSDSGIWNAPSVQKPSDEKQAGALPQNGRQLVAATEEAYGRPLIVGFLQPLAGMMAFNQDDRQVHRHSSGAYTTTAPEGSFEFWHPSGAYVRLGKGAHEPLAQFSANQNWKEVSDADKPTLTVIIPGSSANDPPAFSMTVAPDGTLTVGSQKSAALSAQEGFTFSTPKTFVVNAQGGIEFNGNTKIDGTLKTTGDISSPGMVSHQAHEHIDGGGQGNSGPPAG